MTTILLAALCLALVAALWLSQRNHSTDLRTHTDLIAQLMQTSSEERGVLVTKVMSRAERASDKALTAVSKTADSLSRTFQLQMTGTQQNLPPEQGTLDLTWERAMHPAEWAEIKEEERLAKLQARIDPLLAQDPMMNPDSGWSDPRSVAANLEQERRNGAEPPDPPGLKLPDLSYDPSP